jgi:hypothetical protein
MAELRRARRSGRRIPEFFIVGHAKCGTTAMHQMLRKHPQIFMPVLKETQFLARDPPASGDSKPHQSVRPRTLETYLSLFDGVASELRAGEASTTYLRTPEAAERIAQLCPNARIIAAFREPASFLRSLHLQLLQVGIEDEPDFETAIRLEADRASGRHIPRGCAWPRALLYSQHVRYVEQLRQYHERFGRERVLVVIYDDFRADNERVLRRVLRFLDVDDSLEIEPTEANPTVRVRSKRVHELAHDTAVGRGPVPHAMRAVVKVLTPAKVRRGALRAVDRALVDREPPRPDAELMAELRLRFRGEVVAASEYLARDLVSLWGYDELS